MLGKATAQTALHFGANDIDLRLNDGGELRRNRRQVRMTMHEIIEMIERAASRLWEGIRSTTVSRQCKFVVQFCVE